MSNLNTAVVTLVVSTLALPVAAADGDVFAVLPTQGTGGVTAEAELAGNMMRVALQEQSLALVPAETVRNAVLVNDVACQQSAVACARLVGKDTGATRVVASELWDQGGALELRVVVVDARTGADPGPWQTFRAKDETSLGAVAQRAVLSLVVPGAFFGTLTVVMEPGGEVLVDGVARDRTPMLAPLKLAVGRHEIEVRYGKRSPYRGFVEITMEKPTELRLCDKGDALVDDCGGERPGGAGGPDPLLWGGAIGAGLGVVGLATGGVLGLVTLASFNDYVNETDGVDVTDDQARTVAASQTGAVVSSAVGGALAVAGGVMIALSMME